MKSNQIHQLFCGAVLIALLLVTSQPTPAGAQLIGCEYADIAFVVDSSDSITPEFWTAVKDFLASFVNSLVIGSNAVQVGVIQYSSNAVTAFYLNAHRNNPSLVRAINNLTNIGSQTNTAAGLDMLVSDLFVQENGDRFDAPNIGIVMTDGQSNVRADDVSTSAAAVRARGTNDVHILP